MAKKRAGKEPKSKIYDPPKPTLPEGYVSYPYIAVNTVTQHLIFSNDKKTWVTYDGHPVA